MSRMLEGPLVSTGTKLALAFLPLMVAASQTGCPAQEHPPCIRSLPAPPLACHRGKGLRTAHGVLLLEPPFCPSAIGMDMLNYPL